MFVDRTSPSSGDCALMAERAFAIARLSSTLRWQHPLSDIEDTNWHRSLRAPYESANGSRASWRWRRMEAAEQMSLRQRGKVSLTPHSRFPKGKPGRAGSPHAAKTGRLPPQEGPPPCAIPRRRSEILLDNDRPSHGSHERSDWCLAPLTPN